MNKQLRDWFYAAPLKNIFALLAGLYVMLLLPFILFFDIKATPLEVTALAAPIVTALIAWVAWRFKQ